MLIKDGKTKLGNKKQKAAFLWIVGINGNIQ